MLVANFCMKDKKPWLGTIFVLIFGPPGFFYYRWELWLFSALVMLSFGQNLQLRLILLFALTGFAYWDIRRKPTMTHRFWFAARFLEAIGIGIGIIILGHWISLVQERIGFLGIGLAVLTAPLAPLGLTFKATVNHNYADLSWLVGGILFCGVRFVFLPWLASRCVRDRIKLDPFDVKIMNT